MTGIVPRTPMARRVALLVSAALCVLLSAAAPQARDDETGKAPPPCPAPVPSEGGVPVLRISAGNVPTHFQVKILRRFAEDARRRLAGRLRVEVYDGAGRYRDRGVLPALSLGRVEMGLPGMWMLHSVAPDCGVFMLPACYGAPVRAGLAMADGPPGRGIDASIERNLRVTVLGRWLEPGHANPYMVNHPIRRHEDIAGRRIRVAGGVANELRLAAMGAKPLVGALARRAALAEEREPRRPDDDPRNGGIRSVMALRRFPCV